MIGLSASVTVALMTMLATFARGEDGQLAAPLGPQAEWQLPAADYQKQKFVSPLFRCQNWDSMFVCSCYNAANGGHNRGATIIH